MDSEQVAKIYDKLIEISTDIGQIKADMTTVKGDIKENLEHSDEMDRAFEVKLEKYFATAKAAQNELRDDMEARIAEIEARIKTLEERKSKTLVGWWNKTRDWAIWAIIVALCGYLAVFVKQAVKAIWDFSHGLPQN